MVGNLTLKHFRNESKKGIELRDFSTCTEVGPRPASELCRLICVNIFDPESSELKRLC